MYVYCTYYALICRANGMEKASFARIVGEMAHDNPFSSGIAVLGKDTESVFILEGEVELDEERVVDSKQDLLLSFHVLRLLLTHNVSLL